MTRLTAVGTAGLILLLFQASAVEAIHVQVDYSYDSLNFFPVGSPARQTLQYVADYYSQLLDDSFSPIFTPPPLTSSLPPGQNPGTATWQWSMVFGNPSGGGQITLVDNTLAADEYRMYVGAESLAGSTLGQGGPGGGGWQSGGNGGFFTSEEIDEIDAITDQFGAAVTKRGEASGFARWGGAVTFDSDANANFHFDHTTPPPVGKNDFLSIAFHEFGHALGLGASDEWNSFTNGIGDGAYFTGPASVAAHAGLVVPLAFNSAGGNTIADKAHSRNGTMSTIFGSAATQEAMMDPSITVGTRKRPTTLDAAALTDIGWTVVQPDLPGDFNHDDIVDAADYTVWRDGLGAQYNADDYQTWKSHFGESTLGTAAATSASVPEPQAANLVFAAFFLALALLPDPRTGRFVRRRLS